MNKAQRFLMAGGIATTAHWLSMYMLIQAGLVAEAATAVGAFIGLLVNYRLQHQFAFQSSLQHRVAFPRYVSTSLLAWGLNLSLFSLLQMLGTHTVASQVTTTGTVALVNYLLADRFVFHEESGNDIEPPNA